MEIILKGVTCGYQSIDVLNNLNLSFGTGEFWCILGSNGIGKRLCLRRSLALSTSEEERS